MKTSILSLVMLSLSAAFSPVRLMAQDAIHVTIPFDFNVGSKLFTAGEYSIRQVLPAALALRSSDGRAQMVIMPQAGAPSTTPSVAKITFHRYGDRYFLSRVTENNEAWELARSGAEKALIVKRSDSTSLSLVAAK